MKKHVLLSLLLLLLVACGQNSEKKNGVQSNEKNSKDPAIYIYAEEIGWEDKLPCSIEYRGVRYDGKIKNRGGSSSKYPKHSMTLELKDEISIAGLPKNDDWIFNASYIDKTFQRHKLSFDIFRKMHHENKSPQCAYVPVYLNDNCIGLYVVMEKVNGSWLGFDKRNPKGARLFKDPFVFVEERLSNVQEPENYYQQKFPKQEQKDCNHELDSLKRFLFNSNDETFGKWCYTQIDERNLIDWHLLLLLTNNDDGIFKNFYLYKRGGDQWKFIPWDYDHSFGRDGNYELNLIEREVGWEKVVLLRRLMELQQSGYALKLKRRYEELRKEVFTESALLDMVAENEKMILPHLNMNAELWPMDAEWYFDANNYGQEIEVIKKYIPLRLKQLDTFFSNLDYGEEEKN